MPDQVPEQNERRRILDMLASGQINADEAEELLGALDSSGENDPLDIGRSFDRHARSFIDASALAASIRAKKHREKRIAKSLRIVIDSGDEEQSKRGRVTVTVPLALAKFAGKLIPEEMRGKLEHEGIELTELLEALDDELPEGRLLDVDTNGGEGQKARIVVEVV